MRVSEGEETSEDTKRGNAAAAFLPSPPRAFNDFSGATPRSCAPRPEYKSPTPPVASASRAQSKLVSHRVGDTCMRVFNTSRGYTAAVLWT
jgi:hypothetical protein